MRISEYFDFINREKLPTILERQFLYTHIKINDELMKARRENLKRKKKKTQLKLF